MSVQATSAVWEYSNAQGSALIVMLALANRSDEQGKSYEGVETIAKKCRMQVRNTQYRLRQLEECGEIKIDYGASPYGTNVYQILIPIMGVQSSAPGGASTRPEGVQNRDAGLHPRRSDTSVKTLGASTRQKPNPDCPTCGNKNWDCNRCTGYSQAHEAVS